MMVEREVKVANRNGLHARPAAAIVKAASRFGSRITLKRDDLEVNGKSIMGVMMLAAEFGSTITIRAEGDDATELVDAVASLINNGFGES
jgi:phosphocarrier protein